jgi:hypothetical protein
VRFRFAFAFASAVVALGACLDLGSLQDGNEPDGSSPADSATLDAPLADSATDGVAPDGGDSGDNVDGARVQDDTTIFCGPSLACSRADPNNGCCVSFGDAGVPPESYVYACEDLSACSKPDAGSAPFIACDQGSDCPGVAEVCCWPSSTYPVHTYCFKSDAGNCFTELCDPNDAVPCVNHPGDKCVATGPGVPSATATTPLGYFVCVPP